MRGEDGPVSYFNQWEVKQMAEESTSKEIMTRNDVADEFQIPLRTVDYLVSTGQIPFSRIGRRSVRFTRGRLMEWLREREGVEYRLPR